VTLAVALLGLLALTACSSGGSGPQTGALAPQSSSPQPAPAAKQAVKVVLLVPLSAPGHAGLIGKSLQQAAELALFERDNPSLQLIVKDDKGTPEGARLAADEAIKGGASLILGPLFAKSVSAVAPAARAANIPVVAFSNDRQVAGNGVYLLGFQPEPEVNRIVAYAGERGKKRFVALIPDDAFGKLAANSFKIAVGRSQGTIVAIETYPQSANGLLEPLRKISTLIAASQADAPIDALFLPGAQENLELVGRLLPQAEIDTDKVKLIGTGGMDYPNAGRDARLVGAWFPGPDPSGWSDFVQTFAKSYGQSPPRIASLAYDGVNLAIALSAGAEAHHYSAATLTRASGFTGVDGVFRLLPDGTTERALAILEVGKFNNAVVTPPAGLSQPPSGLSGTASGILKSFNLN
jgi:ABC-type branched-subunit amino acid transport system substrate-binding protein